MSQPSRTQALKRAQEKYYNEHKDSINKSNTVRLAKNKYPFIETEQDFEAWKNLRNTLKKLGECIRQEDIEISKKIVSGYLTTLE